MERKASEIGVGDLVMVMRGHCVHSKAGAILTVKEIVPASQTNNICGRCEGTGPDGLYARLYAGDIASFCPVAWLKKIDPPSDENKEWTVSDTRRVLGMMVKQLPREVA